MMFRFVITNHVYNREPQHFGNEISSLVIDIVIEKGSYILQNNLIILYGSSHCLTNIKVGIQIGTKKFWINVK